jgi:hypothetical protein
LCVGWYAPCSLFLIANEARSTYLSFSHTRQMYQLLLLFFNVRNDGCGLMESSPTEAMSASPLSAQEGRVVSRSTIRSQAAVVRLAQVVYGTRQERNRSSGRQHNHIRNSGPTHAAASSKRNAAKSAGHPRTSRERHYQRRNRGPGREHVVARDCRTLHRPPRRSPCKEARERGVGPGAGAGGAPSVDSAWIPTLASQGL